MQGIASTQKDTKPIVLLCDRGTMDGKAYVAKNVWQRILADNDFTEARLRDNRYDMVIHLSTSADGAEDYYSLQNNTARSEGLQLARDLDQKLQKSWIEHPNFVQIGNDHFETFQEKMDQVVKVAMRFLGIPQTSNFEKKLVLGSSQESLMRDLEEELQVTLTVSKIKDIVFVKDSNHIEFY